MKFCKPIPVLITAALLLSGCWQKKRSRLAGDSGGSLVSGVVSADGNTNIDFAVFIASSPEPVYSSEGLSDGTGSFSFSLGGRLSELISFQRQLGRTDSQGQLLFVELNSSQPRQHLTPYIDLGGQVQFPTTISLSAPQPAAGQAFIVGTDGGLTPADSVTIRSHGFTTQSDSDGRFTFDQLAAGPHYFYGVKSGYESGESRLEIPAVAAHPQPSSDEPAPSENGEQPGPDGPQEGPSSGPDSGEPTAPSGGPSGGANPTAPLSSQKLGLNDDITVPEQDQPPPEDGVTVVPGTESGFAPPQELRVMLFEAGSVAATILAATNPSDLIPGREQSRRFQIFASQAVQRFRVHHDRDQLEKAPWQTIRSELSYDFPDPDELGLYFQVIGANEASLSQVQFVVAQEPPLLTQGSFEILDDNGVVRSQQIQIALSPPPGATKVRVAESANAVQRATFLDISEVLDYSLNTAASGAGVEVELFLQYGDQAQNTGPVLMSSTKLEPFDPEAQGFRLADGDPQTPLRIVRMDIDVPENAITMSINADDVAPFSNNFFADGGVLLDADNNEDSNFVVITNTGIDGQSIAVRPVIYLEFPSTGLQYVTLQFTDAEGNQSVPYYQSILIEDPVGGFIIGDNSGAVDGLNSVLQLFPPIGTDSFQIMEGTNIFMGDPTSIEGLVVTPEGVYLLPWKFRGAGERTLYLRYGIRGRFLSGYVETVTVFPLQPEMTIAQGDTTQEALIDIELSYPSLVKEVALTSTTAQTCPPVGVFVAIQDEITWDLQPDPSSDEDQRFTVCATFRFLDNTVSSTEFEVITYTPASD